MVGVRSWGGVENSPDACDAIAAQGKRDAMSPQSGGRETAVRPMQDYAGPFVSHTLRAIPWWWEGIGKRLPDILFPLRLGGERNFRRVRMWIYANFGGILAVRSADMPQAKEKLASYFTVSSYAS